MFGHLNRTELLMVTLGRGTTDITGKIDDIVRVSGVTNGLCNIFVHHTSASLILSEDADPDVRSDLERWFSRTAPDGDPAYRHSGEGPDDMSSHIRTILTENSLMVPVKGGILDLGRWQGIFLWEHRTNRRERRLTVTVFGA